jgi:Na+/citrate or Na+/malate symporter
MKANCNTIPGINGHYGGGEVYDFLITACFVGMHVLAKGTVIKLRCAQLYQVDQWRSQFAGGGVT